MRRLAASGASRQRTEVIDDGAAPAAGVR